MIISTNAYNADPVNGIILEGNAHNYRYCDVQSIHYPDADYHYEFFFDEEQNQLFACIHCSHKYPNVQLSKNIEDLFIPIIQPKLHHHGFSVINFPLEDFVKKSRIPKSHIINIPCFSSYSNSTQNNANLMSHLIKASIEHI